MTRKTDTFPVIELDRVFDPVGLLLNVLQVYAQECRMTVGELDLVLTEVDESEVAGS